MRQFVFSSNGPRAKGIWLCAGWPFVTVLFVVLFASSVLGSADARQHRRHYYREQAARQSKPKTEFKKPVGALFAVVSLADQHVTFYDANGQYARGLVSTGVPGHETPAGLYTILEKERWHHSNIYYGAPMPWMQRLAWTGVAMHEGAVHPGHTASHGCIRMPPAFAKNLYGVTSIGQRVVISPQDLTPVDIEHAHLPAPKLQMPPAGAMMAKAPAAKGGKLEPVALAPETVDQPQPVNPVEFAKAMKAAAAVKAKAAAAAKKAAQALLGSKSAEARLAAREVAAAEDILRRARAGLEVATQAAGKAGGEEVQKKAAEKKAAAEASLAEAEVRAREAGEAKAARDREVEEAQNAIRNAEAAAAEAAAEAKQAERRMQPVSIFISRKTGRLYVRQATERLFDMPIAIRDPEKPLGTHLFIATRPGDDGASLHWVSLTPPAATEVRIRHRSRRRGGPAFTKETADPVPPFPETAPGALGRIEIPAEAAQQLSGLVWTGATLIISDVSMTDGKFPMDFQIMQHTIVREWD